jgi:hypothetical protein
MQRVIAAIEEMWPTPPAHDCVLQTKIKGRYAEVSPAQWDSGELECDEIFRETIPRTRPASKQEKIKARREETAPYAQRQARDERIKLNKNKNGTSLYASISSASFKCLSIQFLRPFISNRTNNPLIRYWSTCYFPSPLHQMYCKGFRMHQAWWISAPMQKLL